jgi:glycine/D-amino acid oxidase-like deaminating enzyme
MGCSAAYHLAKDGRRVLLIVSKELIAFPKTATLGSGFPIFGHAGLKMIFGRTFTASHGGMDHGLSA